MRLNLLTNREYNNKESSMDRVRALILDDSAASSVEYSILLAGIALAVIASITALGTAVVDHLYNPVLSLFP
jgi:Flp pilus assembly pilin Flp